jgi:hypothetical protein
MPSCVVIYHRKQANPYLSRYGSDWKEYLRKCSSMSRFKCITEKVYHMKDEIDRVMKGT